MCFLIFVLMAGVFTRPELVLQPGLAQLAAFGLILVSRVGITFALRPDSSMPACRTTLPGANGKLHFPFAYTGNATDRHFRMRTLQCTSITGRLACSSRWAVTPPITISRRRLLLYPPTTSRSRLMSSACASSASPTD